MSFRLWWTLAVLVSTSARAEDTVPPGTVVFLSDFGQKDDSVAICKAVMLGIEPKLRIVDLTHDVEPYSVLDGARFLAGAAPYFPKDAVFVAVVDPGVGSKRRALAVRTKKGQRFVLPDNGLITLVERQDEIDEARELTNTSWFYAKAPSSTFQGRDIFSPVAAHLAQGSRWEEAGPVSKEWVRLSIPETKLDPDGLHAAVLAIERPYGNLVTNIDAATFEKLGHHLGDAVNVRLGKKTLRIPFAMTFSDVPKGAPLLYIDSRGRLGLAINLGNFAQANRIEAPMEIVIGAKNDKH